MTKSVPLTKSNGAYNCPYLGVFTRQTEESDKGGKWERERGGKRVVDSSISTLPFQLVRQSYVPNGEGWPATQEGDYLLRSRRRPCWPRCMLAISEWNAWLPESTYCTLLLTGNCPGGGELGKWNNLLFINPVLLYRKWLWFKWMSHNVTFCLKVSTLSSLPEVWEGEDCGAGVEAHHSCFPMAHDR